MDTTAASPETAAVRLRETTQRCVRSLASEYDQIVLSLSGGLDSSILAACLSDAPSNVTCLTLVTPALVSDERRYAQAMADRVQLRLVEGHYEHGNIDLGRSNTAHLPRPNGRALAQEFERLAEAILGRGTARAVFMGGGGDSVFCTVSSAARSWTGFFVRASAPVYGGPLTTFVNCTPPPTSTRRGERRAP
ncbi:asparagine synthase-related protein [Brevundimonas denitrificans]|uniref:asparagine synthase-related protein n=1 Tax=Brevundimonas denitrificans TaxID=1443434 RepID=UPI00352C653D